MKTKRRFHNPERKKRSHTKKQESECPSDLTAKIMEA